MVIELLKITLDAVFRRVQSIEGMFTKVANFGESGFCEIPDLTSNSSLTWSQFHKKVLRTSFVILS